MPQSVFFCHQETLQIGFGGTSFNFNLPWAAVHQQAQPGRIQPDMKNFFLKADTITAISFKVKKDIGKFYDKNINVIYNPIKDIYFDEKIKKDNIFLYVGRASDPVKRFNLVKTLKSWLSLYP